MSNRELADSVRARATIPAGPLVVALSGGADSAVLAWAATAVSDTVRAVFVDHRLDASERLGAAAHRIADELGISLDIVAAPTDRSVPSFEEAARTARYAALMTTVKPDELILTGHTADDQAETVLGHFLRGAGAAGLAGIPARRGQIVRPLLSIARSETRALADLLGLPYADDPENASREPRRNRLRHELIPRLEETYNPQLRRALGRTAGVMAADEALLGEAAERVPILADDEAVSVPAPALAVLPEAIAGRVARRALRRARGPHGGSFEEVSALLDVALGRRTGVELTGGLRVEREGPMVVVRLTDPPPADAIELVVPGRVEFDRWRLQFALTDTGPGPRRIGARTLHLDAGLTGESILIRPGRDDDRIEIGTGTKPVREAMAEAGVARRFRPRWPVVVAGGRLAAIPGVRAADWARTSAETARYLVARIDNGRSAEGT
ncbi:MAG: tRNA lysidine(34) synthetase TilS [Acidimicrobiia bacterium]|nr:tRNA lysidine(34) synthetase TilS [Acidimicrobiia bacterium]